MKSEEFKCFSLTSLRFTKYLKVGQENSSLFTFNSSLKLWLNV